MIRDFVIFVYFFFFRLEKELVVLQRRLDARLSDAVPTDVRQRHNAVVAAADGDAASASPKLAPTSSTRPADASSTLDLLEHS